jgi:hypothetical protein
VFFFQLNNGNTFLLKFGDFLIMREKEYCLFKKILHKSNKRVEVNEYEFMNTLIIVAVV